MTVCCCALAGTAACQHCANNPFATDVWTNKTVTVEHVEAKPFGNGIDVCPVCGKPSTIGKPRTNADRIRSMSDEELAEYLFERGNGDEYCYGICVHQDDVNACVKTLKQNGCIQSVVAWLKQECES